MANDLTFVETCAKGWEREASDREYGADRSKSDYTDMEKRLLRTQANVYRACAKQLREAARRISRRYG